jgi:hypothetical protein
VRQELEKTERELKELKKNVPKVFCYRLSCFSLPMSKYRFDVAKFNKERGLPILEKHERPKRF